MALRKNFQTQSLSMLIARGSARMPVVEARLTPYSLVRSPSALIHTSSSPIRAPASPVRLRLMFYGVSKPGVGPGGQVDASDRHRLPFGPMYIQRRVPYLGSDPKSPVPPVLQSSVPPDEPVPWTGQEKTWRTKVADLLGRVVVAYNAYDSMFNPSTFLANTVTMISKLLRGIDSAPLLARELPLEIRITDKTTDGFLVEVAYRFEVKVVKPVVEDLHYISRAIEAAKVLVRVKVKMTALIDLLDPKLKHRMLLWQMNLATEYLGIRCENGSLKVLSRGNSELPPQA